MKKTMEEIVREEIIRERGAMAMYKRCAKALYLVGNLIQMETYLDALVKFEKITEQQADKIAKGITEDCADLTIGELKPMRSMF